MSTKNLSDPRQSVFTASFIDHLVSPGVKPGTHLPGKDFDPRPRAYTLDQPVELIRLYTVPVPVSVETGAKRLRICKLRGAAPRIHHKLTVVLRQVVGLKPTRLVPDHRKHIPKVPAPQDVKGARQELLCCPQEQMAIVHRNRPGDIEVVDVVQAHHRVVKSKLVRVRLSLQLLHRPGWVNHNRCILPGRRLDWISSQFFGFITSAFRFCLRW